MTQDVIAHLWFTQDFKQLFLIPERFILAPGLEVIHDLQEQKKLVSLAALTHYECSLDAAQEHLLQVWRNALKESQQAGLNLAKFAQAQDQNLDLTQLRNQLVDSLQMVTPGLAPELNDIVTLSQTWVESVVSAAHTSESESDESKQRLFKQVFSQLPQLLEQFSEANLEQASQDPEAWAKQLYQQVFADIEREKHAQHQKKLANDIQQSIAERLRAVGIQPSIDTPRSNPHE
jgi:hypothetical protein